MKISKDSRFIVCDETTGKRVHNISYDEYCRWACLIEAVDFVGVKAKQVGMSPDISKLWLKPLAFQKYIDERYPAVHFEIQQGIVNLEEEGVESLFPTRHMFI